MRQPPQDARVVVMVVTQPGCPACDEFLPRLKPIAASFARAGVVTMHLSAMDPDPEAQAWMNTYGVSATPTTYVLQLGQKPTGETIVVHYWKMDGNQDDVVIRQTYDFAYSLAVR